MKRSLWILVVLAMALVCVSVARAGTVQAVQIATTGGTSASYNSTTEVLTWTGGASGYIMTDDFTFVPFGEAEVSATFSFMTDNSSGGVASASFNSGTWSMDFSIDEVLVVELAGTILGNYNETEDNTDHLNGRSLVTITRADFNEALLISEGFLPAGSTVVWDGGIGSISGLIANIALPVGTGIVDYGSDYGTDNVTITLYEDEGIVPEPATLCLLGFGAVGLLRRRKT